ncbi:MAG: cysteine synthase A, partial [Bacteroidales bacterium]|nr:cysteine synthase A [Bacteroidales bacterium]
THPIQGIGAGFIPGNYNPKVVDKVLTISGEEAYDMTRKLVRTEGIFAGISTGANLAGVAKILDMVGDDTSILTIAYDSGEKYISCKGLYF